jgi:hypothetical protein
MIVQRHNLVDDFSTKKLLKRINLETKLVTFGFYNLVSCNDLDVR